MGDRYDIGVDIGEGKDWWHVHGLTTHEMVYELNKQMCDIGKRLSDPLDPPSEETMKRACDVLERHLKMFRELNRASKKPIEITEEHIKIINRFMEEKKTKKMTKAEAFEYFKGKRVFCDYSNCETIQRKFFEAGIKWRGGSTEVTDSKGSYMFVDLNGYITHCNSREWFDTHEYEEISAEDILSIEIVDEKKDDKRKGEILNEIAKLGEKISDLIEEYGGDVIVEIDLFDVILRNSGDILYRKR